jgi:Domain of unknown function (DUF4388)
MSQPRETTTNNLADVIQVIQIGHRTGTLTVERGETNAFEEGMIVFVNGQIIDAKCGQQNGPVALGWLTTWTTCRFSFIVDASQTSQLPSYPQIGSPQTTTRSGPFSSQRNLSSQSNLSSQRNLSSQSNLSSQRNLSSRPNTSSRTDSRSQTPHTNQFANNRNNSTNPLSVPNHFVVQTPYRIRTDNSVLAFIDQVGLTREHRRLFMLIDGQRTTHELISLMNKNPEKVIELLTDLERAGIVYHA